jgi:sphingomyelin phosphodiesterase
MNLCAGFLLLLVCNVLTSWADTELEEVISQVKNLVSVDRTADDTLPDQLKFLPDFYQHLRTERLTPEERDLTCLACEAAVTAVIDLFLVGVDAEDIESALEGICTLFGITTKSVCHGGIYNYGPIVEFVVKNKTPRITAGEVCAAVLGKGCGAWEEINNWTVDLPELKPEVENPVAPPEGTPVKKILHITDLHLDLTYTVGNNAECDLPMCCGNTSGIAPNPDSAAGYWGSYLCDVPQWTFKHILEHIKEAHDDELDYIMLTGDFPAHDVWLQSKEHNLATAKTVMDYVKEVFPDTQVFPSLGNHEPFPCNM